jgi:hypothetical protein
MSRGWHPSPTDSGHCRAMAGQSPVRCDSAPARGAACRAATEDEHAPPLRLRWLRRRWRRRLALRRRRSAALARKRARAGGRFPGRMLRSARRRKLPRNIRSCELCGGGGKRADVLPLPRTAPAVAPLPRRGQRLCDATWRCVARKRASSTPPSSRPVSRSRLVPPVGPGSSSSTAALSSNNSSSSSIKLIGKIVTVMIAEQLSALKVLEFRPDTRTVRYLQTFSISSTSGWNSS